MFPDVNKPRAYFSKNLTTVARVAGCNDDIKTANQSLAGGGGHQSWFLPCLYPGGLCAGARIFATQG